MARKKQTFLILLGISFGTLLFVSISGVQLGMRKYISNQLLNNTAHVLISGDDRVINAQEVTQRIYGVEQLVHWTIQPKGKRDEAKLENYSGWYERLSKDPLVLDFSPRLATNAMLVSGKFSASVNLMGTLPDRQARITDVDKYMKQGKFRDISKGSNHIILGSGVADNLGARVDQVVNVNGGHGASKPFKIVGIVHYGNKQLDDSIAYTDLKGVQNLTRNPGRVAQIAVALLDPDQASTVADAWQETTKDKVQDWQEANKIFMEMIQVQDFSRYFITISILIVAAFGIYNVLTIMINQKKREIAILRAIGYSPSRILELILYQGITLGFSGALMGLLLGLGMCLWIGSINFGFEIGGSNHLLISYDWQIYVTAFMTANLASLLASYLPAWAASRMTPMEIIRSDS